MLGRTKQKHGSAPAAGNGAGGMEDAGVNAFIPGSASSVNLHELAAESSLLRRLSQRMASVDGHDAMATTDHPPPAVFGVGMGLLQQGASAVVDDSFTRCFKSQKRVAWNWNVYLFPFWCMGVVVRYTVLFPLRCLVLLLGALTVFVALPLVKALATVVGYRRVQGAEML